MEFKLKSPLKKRDVEDLKIGDVVYLSGTIYTARDRAHQRIIEEGCPYNMKGSVIFHAGPLLQIESKSPTASKDKIKAHMVAIGPTTSTRMNPFQDKILKKGVKAIIGKGGMDENTSRALVENTAIYLSAVGGCAALYRKAVKAIKRGYWLDLGIPEAIWELEVGNLGPLIVTMDAKGSNLYQEIENKLKAYNKSSEDGKYG